MLDFLRVVGKLKTLRRTGWGMKGISDAESVAEHMYRAGVCALLLPTSVKRDRCIKMAIVHDLCEALAGDITPHCGVSKEDKHRLEAEAMDKILALLEESEIRSEILELWLEYEAGETQEAQYVKDIDKFEMILQADEYERSHLVDLQSFFDSTQGKFVTPMFQQLDKQLRDQRSSRHQ
jgi:putative hydrolase of HD superfamily